MSEFRGIPAEPPLELTADVTDTAGVLDDPGAAQESVDSVSAETDVDLSVVFVDSFDGVQPESWATQVRDLSSLGGTDAVLAVATDGQYYFSPPSSISRPEAQSIQDALLPELEAGDWDAAVAATADSLIEVVEADGGSAGGAVESNESDNDGGGGLGTLLVFLVIGVIGFVVIIGLLAMANRRKPALPAHEVAQRRGQSGWETLPTPELEQRASSALLAGDEALRESEQELSFARAQFGDAGTEEFQQALATAKASLTEAFEARHQLDERIDAGEVPEVEKRRLLVTVLSRTQQADEALQAQAESMTRLRDLERSLPTLLPALGTRTGTVRTRIDEAERTFVGLSANYATAAVEPVRDNVRHARELVVFAEQRLAQALEAAGEALTESQEALAAQDFTAYGEAQQKLSDAVAAATEAQDELSAPTPAP